MARRKYEFEIWGPNGERLESHQRRCFAAFAPAYASTLLGRDPRATAVFAYESGGKATHAVYRH